MGPVAVDQRVMTIRGPIALESRPRGRGSAFHALAAILVSEDPGREPRRPKRARVRTRLEVAPRSPVGAGAGGALRGDRGQPVSPAEIGRASGRESGYTEM